jgi:queuine tRNA-ribosyltransferase
MVGLGIDMFDCVAPTRLARTGTAMTPDGRLVLRRAAYRDDHRPLVEGCACPACSRFSRAYLRHLFAAGEILGHRLLSLHNVTHVSTLMARARAAIAAGSYASFRTATESRLAATGGGDAAVASIDLDAPPLSSGPAGTARIPGTLGDRG